jgi:hypothetical protein
MGTDQATPEGKSGPISAADLARWGKIYQTGPRALRRWHARGIANSDPCPLDTPNAMPAWWARNSRQIVPEKIMSAARAVTGEKSPAAAPHGTSPDSPPPSASGEPGAVGSPPAAPIDITAFNLDEGQAVAQQRQIVAALFHQLQQAYLQGHPTELLQGRYLKASTALRQLEKDDREDKAHRGRFLLREEQERDAATCADMFRQMHAGMIRRVAELCPDVPQKYMRLVVDAITRVRAHEARCLQRLPTYTSETDLLADLAAA